MTLLNFKIVVAKALIDRRSNRKRLFPPVGQTSEYLMNYPCPEKSLPTYPSSRRSE